MTTDSRQAVFLALGIAVVVALIYHPALTLPFVADDLYVLHGLHHLSLASNLQLLLPGPHAIFFRPLGRGCLLLMYMLFGDHPLPWHLVTLVLHSLNSLLLARLMLSLTQDRLLSAVTALIYAAAIAIHLDPLNWVVCIYDLGATGCFFGSFLLFCERRIAAAALVYGVGCLFKESIIILPLLLLLYELLVKGYRQLWTEVIRAHWKGSALFFAIVGAVGLLKFVQIHAQLDAAGPADAAAPYALSADHVLSNLHWYLKWMTQAFYPAGYAGGDLALLLIVLLLLYAGFRHPDRREARFIFFLCGWLPLGLMPVLFLSNHCCRYYATYSLPAFILLALYGLKMLLSRYPRPLSLLTGLLCLTAIGNSLADSRTLYADPTGTVLFREGTSQVIRDASVLNTVNQGLAPYLASLPDHASVLVAGINIASSSAGYGPQLHADGKTFDVYYLSPGEVADGAPCTDEWVEGRPAFCTAAPGTGFFAFNFSHGLIRPLATGSAAP